MRAVAQRLFARHGFAAVSMRQIAAEVGVQAGALYNYTPDKQSLLFDIMRTHIEDALSGWAEEPKGQGAVAALSAFARFHIRFHFDRPETMFIANMELRNLTPENFAVIEAMRGRYEGKLQDILRAGVAEGVFAVPDLRLATMALLTMLTGVTTWYRDDGRLPRETVENIYCDMVQKAVAA